MSQPTDKVEAPKSQLPSEAHVHGPDCSHGHHHAEPFVRNTPKLGRNDPCYCGSQLKFKKCHGSNLASLG